MQTVRQGWTDERLDDFRAEVGQRFDAVGQRFDRVEGELRDLRAEAVAIRSETKAGFDDLHRLIVTVGGGLIGTVIVALAGLIATQL